MSYTYFFWHKIFLKYTDTENKISNVPSPLFNKPCQMKAHEACCLSMLIWQTSEVYFHIFSGSLGHKPQGFFFGYYVHTASLREIINRSD
jgi:hypothetical protein